MAEAEPLFALLEIMLRTFNVTVPKVQPGGYPDDIFLRIPEEERENLECSICYQVMKEVRQCVNNHKFCYSCIFVWSTSGNPVNHGRCPVCRAEGNYIRNKELDERINKLIVKCSTKGCRWIGPLRHQPSHQHTTYSDTAEVNSNELPSLSTNVTPDSRSKSNTVPKSSSQNTLTPVSSQSQPNVNQQRRPLANVSNNASQSRSSSVSHRQTNSQNPPTHRSRTRTRSRTNSSSPQRRITTTATGLNTRLTSRARIQNGPEIPTAANTSRQRDEHGVSEVVTQTTETPLTPRPPVTPRPQGSMRRRVPTLPSLMNSNNNNENVDNVSADQTSVRTDNNNNVSDNDNANETLLSARRNPLEGSIGRRVSGTPRGFATVRDRLNESRQRLDMLMNAFSVELDRGRHDLTAFQQERERRRQEQLSEVRDLGIRLGQVATELRGLLSQRRQIRNQIDHLVESSAPEDSN